MYCGEEEERLTYKLTQQQFIPPVLLIIVVEMAAF